MSRLEHGALQNLLPELQDPILRALYRYEEISNGALIFELDELDALRFVESYRASHLKITPDKPNSARSQTPARHLGEVVGDLFVIAFQPQDGTGAEVPGIRELNNLYILPPYPTKAGSVPRNKTGIDSEVHMTVVRHRIDDVHADPELFAGTFDLLGLGSPDLGPTNVKKWLGRVTKIGELGHTIYECGDMDPITTYTVGYRPGPDGKPERFGDPHAVLSTLPDYIQVCAFLALKDEVAKRHPGLLGRLNPQFPRPAA